VWVEEYLFFPNLFQRVISILLLPLTLLYMLIVVFKRLNAKPKDFGLPIISIGNIIVGGSGKTPFTIFLAQQYDNVAVILRGYGRASKGLYVIQHEKKLLHDIQTSGDEAMLLCNALKDATVIVSEDREKAIEKAKELGCKIILLDDGFSKYNIGKFDILLRPKKEPTNLLCLPSGGYREPKMMYAYAHMVLKEGVDFKRVVSYIYEGNVVSVLPHKLLLLTAISKPQRLLEFLPQSTLMESFPDHHDFTQQDIDAILKKYEGFSFITTSKDRVKLDSFELPNLYLMELDLEVDESIDFSALNEYLHAYEDIQE
jgi:tetraacyldisaccharide 4'-kinase